MKHSLKIEKSQKEKGVEFPMYIPVAPVVADCQITSLRNDFHDDHFIIDQAGRQSNLLRYQKVFIEKPTAKYNFYFPDMNILHAYKIRCLVQNTSSGTSNQSFSFGIGLFEGSQVLGLLNPMISSITPSQCVKLTFDTLNVQFPDKLKEHCEITMNPTGKGLFG